MQSSILLFPRHAHFRSDQVWKWLWICEMLLSGGNFWLVVQCWYKPNISFLGHIINPKPNIWVRYSCAGHLQNSTVRDLQHWFTNWQWLALPMEITRGFELWTFAQKCKLSELRLVRPKFNHLWVQMTDRYCDCFTGRISSSWIQTNYRTFYS